MKTYSKQTSIKIFRAMRWVTVISFIAIALNLTQLKNNEILIIAVAAYIISFSYIAFWKCPSCKKTFGSSVGFISICWPYVSRCLKCKTHLNDM